METNSVTDYLQSLHDLIPALQMGLLPDGVGQVYHKFAESDHITTVSTILSSNENPDPFNTTGKSLYLSSASATDTQLVYIEGIDFITRELTAEYLTLDGNNPLPLVNGYYKILRAYNANGTEFTGDAYIGSNATPPLGIPAWADVYAHIPGVYQGRQVNQTISSTFTVPIGFTGFITNWYGTASKGKDTDLIAYARTPGSIFRYQERMFNFESSSQKQLPWLKFPERADFKVEVVTSQGTVDGSLSYDIILVSNDFISKFRPLSWR